MAKVFVSGQIGDISVVQRVQAALVAAGHEITHDWTRNEGGSKMLVGQQTKFDQAAESARRATLSAPIMKKQAKVCMLSWVERLHSIPPLVHHEFICWVNASMQQSFISIPRFACVTR